ncbi:serine hydrolase domain-containing protein [Tenacibaculum amylolyticum]|uniref:serine hydrolase domain-containing protein n=1 Tax=Tenacibaculum amylolyticum TaxID=104269 RepID=UPI0038930690
MKKHAIYTMSIVCLLYSCNNNVTKTKQQKITEISTATLPSFKNKIDSLFTSLEQKNEFMGSISISQNDKVIYQNTIGFEDIATSEKASNATYYKIGSISKTYTAALILKAIEEQKITLDQSIDLFFPNIKEAKNITIKNLLNHSSGIPSYTKYSNFLSYHTQPKTKEELLTLITQVQDKHYTNPKAEYSNSNYVLLTFILEKIYQSDFKTILSEKITAPLQLNNTYYLQNNSPDIVQSYTYNNNSWKELPITDLTNALGAGGIIATSTDVNNFLNALFNQKIINQNSLGQMQQIEQGFGLGLVKLTLSSRSSYGHHGDIDGYSASAFYFPEEKLAITITSNASNNNIDTILNKVLKLYFNDPILSISTKELKKFTGTYYNPKDSTEESVFITENDKLVHVIQNEFKRVLIYKGNRTFLLEQAYAEAMYFTFSEDGKSLSIKQGNYNGTAIKK